MTLRTSPVPHFWETVNFRLMGDYGQAVDATFKAKFRRLEQAEFENLVKRIQAARIEAILGTPPTTAQAEGEAGTAPAEPAAPKPITDQEVVEMVLLDWDDVLDEHDQPRACTKDNRELVWRILGCRAAVVRTFMDAHEKAAAKNFGEPPATASGT